MKSTKTSKLTYSKQQIGLSVLLSSMLSVITIIFFGNSADGVLVGNKETKRAFELFSFLFVFVMFLIFCGLSYWSFTNINTSGRLIVSLAFTASFIISVRLFLLTLKFWKRLK